MIRLQGNLEFHSANSQIRLFRKDGEAICAIQGWPQPFSLFKLSQIKLPKVIKHEKVKILYNNRQVGYFQNGSFKLTGYFAGLLAFFDYLKSMF